MHEVTLTPFCRERDLPRLSAWLQQPHVARAWGDPAVALSDLARRDPDTAALILLDGQPVGVLCWQPLARSEREAAGLAELPGDVVDVDIILGEPHALGRGVGPAALRQLFERLSNRGVTLVGLATSSSNRRALAAFAKTGLVPCRDFVEGGEQYRYCTKRLVRASQP